MNEIIQRLIEKTGLPEDKARMALDTVVQFLKERLPGPMAAQIDGFISGDSGMSGKVADMAAGLSGAFGKKE